MSIRSRIKEAQAFWQEGRKQDALLAALSAASDTAKKRYTQAQDGAALAHFVADAAADLAPNADLFDWSFRGGVSLGEVLHTAYRSLLDSRKLPPDIELVAESPFQIHILPGNRRAYSDCLIPRLIDAVRHAPENAKDFAK